MALRAPIELWICFGPAKTETCATAKALGADRGKTNMSQALMFLAPASSSPDEIRLVTYWSLMPLWHSQWRTG